MGLVRRFLTGPFEDDGHLVPGIVDRGDRPTLVMRDGSEVALDTLAGLPATYQPLDSDLTAIAALATTSYGRSLLTLANQAALQTALGGFLSALDSNQYAIVACVIRNDGAGWYMLLDDTQHHPLNVDSITNDVNQIVIDYTSHGFSETVGFYAVVDETLAQYGFSIGASVTAAQATLKIGQQRTLGADIGWNGSAFVVNNQNADPTGHFAIGSYSGGDLHVTHDDIGASSKSNITLVSRGDTYTAMVPNDNGVTNTDFFAAFYTPGSAGWTKQTVAATGMRFYVTRTASQHVNPNNITTVLYPNSDFWCFGIFKR